jgi:hypothetical protein
MEQNGRKRDGIPKESKLEAKALDQDTVLVDFLSQRDSDSARPCEIPAHSL